MAEEPVPEAVAPPIQQRAISMESDGGTPQSTAEPLVISLHPRPADSATGHAEGVSPAESAVPPGGSAAPPVAAPAGVPGDTPRSKTPEAPSVLLQCCFGPTSPSSPAGAPDQSVHSDSVCDADSIADAASQAVTLSGGQRTRAPSGASTAGDITRNNSVAADLAEMSGDSSRATRTARDSSIDDDVGLVLTPPSSQLSAGPALSRQSADPTSRGSRAPSDRLVKELAALDRGEDVKQVSCLYCWVHEAILFYSVLVFIRTKESMMAASLQVSIAILPLLRRQELPMPPAMSHLPTRPHTKPRKFHLETVARLIYWQMLHPFQRVLLMNPLQST